MLQFKPWQTALIIGLIVIAGLFALPNALPAGALNNAPGFVPKNQINLGLDLQGGSYLLLQVDTEELIDNKFTNLRTDIQRTLRPVGNRERIVVRGRPSFNADEDVMTVRVRDEAQVDEAVDRIRDVLNRGGLIGGNGPLRPYQVSATGARIEIRMTDEAQQYFIREAVGDSIEVVRRRIDPAGNKEVSIQPQGDDRIVLQAPGDNDPERLKEIITGDGQLTFHAVDTSTDPQDAEAGLLPPERIVVPMTEQEGQFGGSLVLVEDPVITGDMVQSASAGVNSDSGGFQINFAFDNRGARAFGEFTRANIGFPFAIVLDNEIISAPTIQSAITGGQGRITGQFSAQEAQRIATLIRAGALPASLTTIEQRSVGAELGKDSIEAGSRAFIIGFIGVIIYMVLSYGRFGVYANIALIANMILIVGALTLFGSTLTLPGIAGIVLTIGMAVDANVLIFERIREELLAGKPPVKSVEQGFLNAKSAIFDANVTTFAAAFLMFLLGAGPVRGFAITLMIGVVTSVFTAFVLTRLMAGGWVLSTRPKTLKV